MLLTWHYLIFLFSKLFLYLRALEQERSTSVLAERLYPITPRPGTPSLLAEHVGPAGACDAIRAQETRVYITILRGKVPEYASAWQKPKKDDKNEAEARQKGGKYK